MSDRYVARLGLACTLPVLLTGLAIADPQPENDRLAVPMPVIRGAELSAPVTPYVFDGKLSDLPPAPQWKPGDPIREIPRRYYPSPDSPAFIEPGPGHDPLVDKQRTTVVEGGGETFTTPNRNFAGIGYTGVQPPDTVGDVGPNHYIQSVNTGGGADVRIWDKAEPTPNQLVHFRLDNLGSAACASGFGDPIVLYDRLADRWMISEFSGAGNNLCVYISQGPDPVNDGWFNYQYSTPNFPDYPKYGIWPTDANGGSGSYVVTANDGGPGVFALERGAMLSGSASTSQRLVISNLPGFGFEAPTPPDLDGPTPPATFDPAPIMRHRDTEAHSGPSAPGDLLEMWLFNVDWQNSSNTTLAVAPSIDVAEFDSSLCGLTSFSCFDQPGGGSDLDPLREVIMNRLQYMNHGTHETLAGNLVTDVNGSNLGGVRWFELRRVGGGPWELYQEGTYSPDGHNRWMGAGAIDQSGNYAVAYNIVSTSVYPGLRYTGRLANDPLDVMTQPETVIHSGAARNSSNRYGDYASMNLDPSDDCTFWFTGENNTSSSWRTQVASFRFLACGCDLFPDPPAASAVAGGDNVIDVSWGDSQLNTVAEYRLSRSDSSGGPFEQIAVVTDTSPGTGSGADYVYFDTTVSGGSTYFYTMRASDGLACTSLPSAEASATATGACLLAPQFDGLESVNDPSLSTCTLELSWNAAAPRCSGPVTYDVYRSTLPDFTPGPGNLLVAGVTDSGLTDVDNLIFGVTYFYLVRATDQTNGYTEDNTVYISGSPTGGGAATSSWTDDAGDDGPSQMILEGAWIQDQTGGVDGSRAYATGAYPESVYIGLRTPELLLGPASLLSFSSVFDIEHGWDKGEVQISTDRGASWQRLALDYPAEANGTRDNGALPAGSYFTGTQLEWTTFFADLSAWEGRDVVLRFALSSDEALAGAGWWIDEIRVSSVVGGGVCTPGTACPENPLINVSPDGPLLLCAGEGQLLLANTTGGVGPFLYQWTQDGIDLPGATDSSFVAADMNGANYNVRVRAEACADEIEDTTGVDISRVSAPYFDGIQSAADAQDANCSLDLSWNAATSLCPGPLTYTVYRSTSPAFTPDPSNRVASGITGTAYTDVVGVAAGTSYHYTVRAMESSTGVEETNNAKASDFATGLSTGIAALLSEDFEDAAAWGTWQVATGPGPHDCAPWDRLNVASTRPSLGAGRYAVTNSSRCGAGSNTSTDLLSPEFDGDIADAHRVTLDFDIFYRHGDGDDSSVEVWDGSQWQTVWADTDSDIDGHLSIDITDHVVGNNAARLRFRYQNAAFDLWFAVDNVEVILETSTECSVISGTPGVPDGTAGTSPLSGARLTPAGDSIQVGWDVSSCTSAAYNLIFGDLADVASVSLSGSQCSIGSSGSFTWNGVPAGDLFFLVVGTDGAGFEGSWGETGAGVERNGATPTGDCGVSQKDPLFHCP